MIPKPPPGFCLTHGTARITRIVLALSVALSSGMGFCAATSTALKRPIIVTYYRDPFKTTKIMEDYLGFIAPILTPAGLTERFTATKFHVNSPSGWYDGRPIIVLLMDTKQDSASEVIALPVSPGGMPNLLAELKATIGPSHAIENGGYRFTERTAQRGAPREYVLFHNGKTALIGRDPDAVRNARDYLQTATSVAPPPDASHPVPWLDMTLFVSRLAVERKRALAGGAARYLSGWISPAATERNSASSALPEIARGIAGALMDNTESIRIRVTPDDSTKIFNIRMDIRSVPHVSSTPSSVDRTTARRAPDTMQNTLWNALPGPGACRLIAVSPLNAVDHFIASLAGSARSLDGQNRAKTADFTRILNDLSRATRGPVACEWYFESGGTGFCMITRVRDGSAFITAVTRLLKIVRSDNTPAATQTGSENPATPSDTRPADKFGFYHTVIPLAPKMITSHTAQFKRFLTATYMEFPVAIHVAANDDYGIVAVGRNSEGVIRKMTSRLTREHPLPTATTPSDTPRISNTSLAGAIVDLPRLASRILELAGIFKPELAAAGAELSADRKKYPPARLQMTEKNGTLTITVSIPGDALRAAMRPVWRNLRINTRDD